MFGKCFLKVRPLEVWSEVFASGRNSNLKCFDLARALRLVWILLLVVGINPTTLFQNISQLRNEKDMADRNEAFGKSSIEARKR